MTSSVRKDSVPELAILYKDRGTVALDKPEGLVSIPDRSQDGRDVRSLAEKQLGEPLWTVHRIDKPVSGVLVFARTECRHRELSLQFQERHIRKEYLALVHGEIRGTRGRISSRLRTFGSGRVGVDENRGKECLTEYRVLGTENGYSLIQIFPRTGRRHQIRAHLYSIGSPIVGDDRYGEEPLQKGFPRLMLHARRIHLPASQQTGFAIESPVPTSFLDALEMLMVRIDCV